MTQVDPQGRPVGPGYVGTYLRRPHHAKPSHFLAGVAAGASLGFGLGLGPPGVLLFVLLGLLVTAMDEDAYEPSKLPQGAVRGFFPRRG